MLKFACVLALVAASALPAAAACVGSEAFSTCTDESGNTYSVSRFGNMTQVQGTGANGQSWNQTSQTLGNQTFTNGTAANGNAWNEQQTQLGGGNRFVSGTNAQGQPYTYNCTLQGCN